MQHLTKSKLLVGAAVLVVMVAAASGAYAAEDTHAGGFFSWLGGIYEQLKPQWLD